MSGRTFPFANLSEQNIRETVESWDKVYAERGENHVIAGIMQLILDLLRHCCNNAHVHDFELPKHMDLRTFDLNHFMSAQIENKVFDVSKQRDGDVKVASLLINLIEKLNDLSWLQHISRFICVLFENKETSLLVTNTVVYLYRKCTMQQSKYGRSSQYVQQLQVTCRYLSSSISSDDLEHDVLERVINPFFDEIARNSKIIQNDEAGCIQIIARLLAADDVQIRTRAFDNVKRLCRRSASSAQLMRLCANAAIVRAVSDNITLPKSVKLRISGLELAIQIESANDGQRIFGIAVFQDCVRSDSKNVRHLVVELLRSTHCGPSNNDPNTSDVLTHAIEVYQRFRTDDIDSPPRLIGTFYTEFTDWDAVFQVVQSHLAENSFIECVFFCMETVFQQIEKKENKERHEDLLRSYLHMAIEFMHKLDRQHVNVFGHIILSIGFLQDNFKFADERHTVMCANILQEICGDYFDEFVHQMNTLKLFKKLMLKKYITDEVLRKMVDRSVVEFNQLKPSFDENANFEECPQLMRVFMKLSGFAWYNMISEQAVTLCKGAYTWAITKPLDLTQNRTFLAYNLIIVVYACVEIQKTAGGSFSTTVPGVSRTRISTRLLEICDQTENDLDFLSQSVFWCLTQMELNCKGISHVRDIKVFEKFVVKKISLVGTKPQHEVLESINYIGQMVSGVKALLSNGGNIDLCEMVTDLQKDYSKSELATDLLKHCAEIREEDMFTRCVISVLKKLTKMAKKDFMKTVESLLVPLANGNLIRQKILTTGSREFGKRKQEELGGQAAKRAKDSADILRDITYKEWDKSLEAAAESISDTEQ